MVDIPSIWNFTQRAFDLHPKVQSSTCIPPLQAILRLTLFETNPLGPPSRRLDIPSIDYLTLGGAFLRLLCCDMDEADQPLQKKPLERLAELGLSDDDNFATSFSQQFLGNTSFLVPWSCASNVMDMKDSDAYFKVADRREMFLFSFRLFRAANGALGSGPCNMEPSDWVFILKGCNLPVILRQVGSQYELVGTANVIGIMDGELCKQLNDLAFQEINIL